MSREWLRKRNGAVPPRVGATLGREMEVLPTLSARNEYLRLRCGSLGEREVARRTKRRSEALAAPLLPALLEHAIVEPPVSAFVVREENYSLHLLRGDRPPASCGEMGRVREMTFREAGRARGRPRDVDRCDGRYWRLILWDDAARDDVARPASLGAPRHAPCPGSRRRDAGQTPFAVPRALVYLLCAPIT